MSNRVIKFLLIIDLLFICSGSKAQEADDFGIWQSLSFKAGLGPKADIGLWLEHRSKERAQTLDCAIVMPFVNWSPSPYLTFGYSSEYYIIGSGARYITCRPAVTLNLGSGDLKFSLREMFLYEHGFTTGTGSWTLRSRAKVSYKIPETSFKPYISCEIFTWEHWKKTRHYAGVTYPLGRHSTLDLFYMYYVMSSTPNHQRHVAGVSYSFHL